MKSDRQRSGQRLGFVTTSFPRFPGDYAGNFVFHMAEAFAQKGFDIDVVSPAAPTHTLSSDFPSWLNLHPVPYIWPSMLQRLCYGNGIPENIAQSPFTAALIPPLVHRMWQQIEKLAPRWDGIFSHWLLPSALIAPRIPGISIPHVAVAHSGDVHLLGKMPFRSLLSATILRRCTVINFVSRQLKDEFCKCLPAHLRTETASQQRVTPMGLPENQCTLSKSAARLQLGWRYFTVLYVGRLSPIKGVNDLITAIMQLQSDKSAWYKMPVQLIIAGDGEQKSTLEYLARHNRRNDWPPVQFTGTVRPVERDTMLKAADVLVVPSVNMPDGRHEGAPTIIAEAMRAGLPVIATKTGGIPESVIHHKTGLLVPERCPECIAQSINFIRDNTDATKRMTIAAQSFVRPLEWNLLIKKFMDMLYKK